jgi:glycine/D-amino acid oxidase-like deaminating enzyme
VIALNAWAAGWRRFRRLLTVRGSYIALTAPAPERLEELGWTNGMGVWDHRAALHYLRTTPDGRLAFGVGGMQPGLARTIGPRFAWDERAVRVAVEDLLRLFPSFEGVPIEAAWGGPIDVAGHHLPFFGGLERGNVQFGLGYTGNGVGPSHLGGRILAARVLEADEPDLLSLPIVTERPMRFPPEPIRTPGAYIANQAIWRKDQLEDRGEDVSPLVDFVARLPRRLGYNLGP